MSVLKRFSEGQKSTVLKEQTLISCYQQWIAIALLALNLKIFFFNKLESIIYSLSFYLDFSAFFLCIDCIVFCVFSCNFCSNLFHWVHCFLCLTSTFLASNFKRIIILKKSFSTISRSGFLVLFLVFAN